MNQIEAQRLERAEATIARVEALHQPFTLYEPCPSIHGCDSYHCCEDVAVGGEYYHSDEPTGRACAECHDEDGNHAGWPCPTVAALRGPEPTEATSNEDAPRLDVGADAPTPVGAETTDAP